MRTKKEMWPKEVLWRAEPGQRWVREANKPLAMWTNHGWTRSVDWSPGLFWGIGPQYCNTAHLCFTLFQSNQSIVAVGFGQLLSTEIYIFIGPKVQYLMGLCGYTGYRAVISLFQSSTVQFNWWQLMPWNYSLKTLTTPSRFRCLATLPLLMKVKLFSVSYLMAHAVLIKEHKQLAY